MERSWADEIGVNELAGKFGNGTVTGALIGGGIAALAALTGLSGFGGWLAFLMIPAAAVIGGIAGDYAAKDGPVFGANGLANALKQRNAPKTIPEGYLAVSPDAASFAVSGEVIAKTGQVHANGVKTMSSAELYLGYQEARALDPFPEFDLSKDIRLKVLREKATQYGDRFAVKDSPEYIANVHQREEKITHLILSDVYKTYGAYSAGTLSSGRNNDAEYDAVHHPKRLILGGKSVDFGLIKKDQLICRHYAPIMSVLLHDAHVPNHMVASTVGMAKNENGHLVLDKKCIPDILRSSGWSADWPYTISPHVYVITDEGNAIVEGTTAGKPKNYVDKHGWLKNAYTPIVNGVTVQDIIFKGKTAIPDMTDGTMQLTYGGDKGMGADYYKVAEKSIEANIGEYTTAQQKKRADKAKKAVDIAPKEPSPSKSDTPNIGLNFQEEGEPEVPPLLPFIEPIMRKPKQR